MSDKPTWTPEELKKFDRLTKKLHSLNQVERITGRMQVMRFQDEHGVAKCDAMFAVLKARDKKRPGGERP